MKAKPYNFSKELSRNETCTDCGREMKPGEAAYYSCHDNLGRPQWHCVLPCESIRRNLDGTKLRKGKR